MLYEKSRLDCSLQIGFEIILTNEQMNNNKFKIKGNLIIASFTKLKRITRSVLAFKIYGIVARLDLLNIPIIICIDLYSLYECLVKLGITKEKRLMIDIILVEIRWINRKDNPADAITKSTLNKALIEFINTNEIDIRIEVRSSRYYLRPLRSGRGRLLSSKRGTITIIIIRTHFERGKGEGKATDRHGRQL
ncbi:unnamed protein product [Diplocarpon coronariae]